MPPQVSFKGPPPLPPSGHNGLGALSPPHGPKGSNGLQQTSPSSGRLRLSGSLSSGNTTADVGPSVPSKKPSLKPLHWVKVTRAMQEILWVDTQKQEDRLRAPEIDISELESLFSAASVSENSKGGARRGAKINKPEKLQLADNVALSGRATAFGILSGISSCSFVFGDLSTHFLPSTASVFQVAAAVAMVSVVYMRIFLPESSMEAAVITASLKEGTMNECLLEKKCTNNRRPFRTSPSLKDSISLFRSRYVVHFVYPNTVMVQLVARLLNIIPIGCYTIKMSKC